MPVQPLVAVFSLAVAIIALISNNDKSPFHYTKLVKYLDALQERPLYYHKRMDAVGRIGVDVVVYLARALAVAGLVIHWSELDVTHLSQKEWAHQICFSVGAYGIIHYLSARYRHWMGKVFAA